MSSPISRTDSPSLEDHAKRKRDDVLEKQAGGVVHSEVETVPPKKIKPEDENTTVSKEEVKQIQRELKTMPLEDNKNSSHDQHQHQSKDKDMDDVESEQSSPSGNGEASQDRHMEESSQQLPTKENDDDDDVEGEVETPSEADDQDNASVATKTPSEQSTSSTPNISDKQGSIFGKADARPSGFGNTSSTSPFASAKPVGESIFGSSSTTLKGFSATTGASPFASVEKSTNALENESAAPISSGFGGSSFSGGFGNTSSMSPFGTMASKTNSFGGSESKSVFGGSESKNVFGGSESKSVFGSSETKSAFGQSGNSPLAGSATTPATTTASSAPATPSKSTQGASDSPSDSTVGSIFGARSVLGSVSAASPASSQTSSQKASPFATFGSSRSFGKEGSFMSGSFIDETTGSQERPDFGSLLSQDITDTNDEAEELEESEQNFGAGIFTNADQIEVHTGEEDEYCIYQTKGKLYVDLDRSHSWKERGKGTFKVNIGRRSSKTARLVMRADGVLRLILNVSIFPSMQVTITGDKYIRFVAIEDGKPIAFLLKVKDATVAEETVNSITEAVAVLSKEKGDETR